MVLSIALVPVISDQVPDLHAAHAYMDQQGSAVAAVRSAPTPLYQRSYCFSDLARKPQAPSRAQPQSPPRET
jgi:hypothetical protein